MALLAPDPKICNTGKPSGWMVVIQRCIVAVLLLLPRSDALSQDIEAPEYKIKAAFLYNFTKLVEWPTNVFATHHAPLVIGVLGKSPFGKELQAVTASRVIDGHPLQTVQFNSVEQITNCHVLFISDSERRKLDSILETLRHRPILTVGDMKGFEARGMITFIKTNDSINLRINLEAAQEARLQLSSRLIRLDRSLRPVDDGLPPVSPPKSN